MMRTVQGCVISTMLEVHTQQAGKLSFFARKLQ